MTFQLTDPPEVVTSKALSINPLYLNALPIEECSYQLQWLIKRFIDIAGSLVGLILISPILLLIAIAIKLESKGPVFFKQKRVGLQGENFDMYKFRSMKQNAENELDKLKQFNESNNVMFKMKKDPRVTKVGEFIRKHSLDELPQLINVLKGEMSLIGPRPPLVTELKDYKPWHYKRFETIPGMTGLWQVSGRSSITNFDKVVKLDLRYIKEWSLLLDLNILLKTVPIVIWGKE